MPRWILLCLALFFSCSQEHELMYEPEPIPRCVAEASQRLVSPPFPASPCPIYPWDQRFAGNHVRITKEFFRCRGNCLNAPRIEGGQTISDCSGEHSLPIREGTEEIYPVLLDLLNYLQEATGCRVVITCGHRCPQHNKYADSAEENRVSKHLIGAEVDFYLEGMQERPEEVVALLQSYYQERSGYHNWSRYLKRDTNVSIPPWYNKEIFIKLFQKHEGRDYDNNHPYPYLSIQVRHDRSRHRRVFYSWDEATYGYAVSR